MRATSEHRILVVDDEPSIADAVSTAFRDAQFSVTIARSGRTALRELRAGGVALVVLDIMLPDISGFDVASILRDEGNSTPILFLTARDAIGDKVRGLRSGDDYLTKPFVVAELVARVEAILRRTRSEPPEQILRCADVELNAQAHTATRSAKPLRLTATEFRLLQYFMTNADRVVSKQQILNEVWGFAFEGDDGVVETYVRYLRRKLETHGDPLIETVRLVGYVLRSRK